MHYFSFEISNAPDWCEDVRRCRTGLNPHFLFVLPKRLPGFPAELYRFGTEKPGGYSLLKRECPPRPPKEKRGGISISPRTPLKRHKGAKLRFLPFGNPSKDKGSGSGKRGRECPLCTPMNAVPPNAGTQLFEEYLSAQPVGDFWILPAVRTGQPYVLGELTVLAVNSSRTLFLFHRARRIFFLAFQKENGGCIWDGQSPSHVIPLARAKIKYIIPYGITVSK